MENSVKIVREISEKEEGQVVFDVWKNVLAEIERNLTPSSYLTWFGGATLLSIKDGVVTVGVPNFMKRSHIESRYNHLVQRALKNNGVEFDKVVYELIDNSPKVRKGGIEVTEKTERPERVKKVKTSDMARFTIATGLKREYTIDNFVVGSNNDLAVSVAKAVIENPGKKYNPFFLYGGSGLGKTHLVMAIGNELLRRNPNMRILYVPINHFYTEFVNAVRNGRMDGFRKKYQKLDLLIIDDFQFIVGKEKSQEEFFNIFNDMYQANKQIIVTSDRLPSQIKTVDERLASRLTWMGAYDLQMPSLEDRCAILKAKAEYSGVEIEDEAIEYLAENVKTNIRALEKEFHQILALAELKGRTPLELINDGYVNNTRSTRSEISPRTVVERVAKYYQLSVKELKGKSRVSHIKTARQVAMFLLTEELSLSTTKIATEVGVKDHTTVMHGIKKIKNDLKLDFALREQISEIRESLNA